MCMRCCKPLAPSGRLPRTESGRRVSLMSRWRRFGDGAIPARARSSQLRPRSFRSCKSGHLVCWGSLPGSNRVIGLIFGHTLSGRQSDWRVLSLSGRWIGGQCLWLSGGQIGEQAVAVGSSRSPKPRQIGLEVNLLAAPRSSFPHSYRSGEPCRSPPGAFAACLERPIPGTWVR